MCPYARLMMAIRAPLIYVSQANACTSRSTAMTATPAPLTPVITIMIACSIRYALMTVIHAPPTCA